MDLLLLQIKNMLEPIVSKGTRWVLRRGGVSNHSDLSDSLIKTIYETNGKNFSNSSGL